MLGYGAAWACWWPRVWGTPVWINVDGLEWVRSKWGFVARQYLKFMESVAARAATRLIADAEAIAQRFRQQYPRGAQCTTIAYGADVVDATLVSKKHLPDWGLEPGRYFLVVARPEPENHILEMIEGYLQHDTQWPLVVVGDITGATAYQRRLLALRSERVMLIGAIYDHQKLTALRAHTALYLHGHSVGGTNPSLLEAMACGNLVLAHDNVFNREVAGDSASYFKTANDLAPAICSLFRLSQDCLSIRRQQLQNRVRTQYSWDSIVDKYVHMLAELA
jgi:glycosyltransferase involved in cell wall biosynthesis